MRKFVKISFVILNVFFLVAMLCSTMAGKVAPSKFIGFSMAGYLYLYLAVANLGFVIFWLCFGSKWFLMSLVAILLRFSFLPLYFQVGGTDEIGDDEFMLSHNIRVMTFNVNHFRGEETDASTVDSNMLHFLEMVDSESPDVLALQEYAGAGNEVDLTEALKSRGYVYSTSANSKGRMVGEVIFSRLPFVGTECVKMGSIVYADLLWTFCNYDDVMLADTVRIYCLHLHSYGLDDSDQQEIQQIKSGNLDSTTGRSTYHKFHTTILSHEEEWNTLEPLLESHNRMTVLAGDFNDPPASYVYQRGRKYFKDSYCEAGQGFSTTYHGDFSSRKHGIFPSFRIDMILHSPDMKAWTYKRIKSVISDHYPIIVALIQSDKCEPRSVTTE